MNNWYKTKLYRNVLLQKDQEVLSHDKKIEQIEAACRGCSLNDDRQSRWVALNRIRNLKAGRPNKDSTYLMLEEDPGNPHNENAVCVCAGGECFGTVGYIARSSSALIKEKLRACSAYRVDMLQDYSLGQKEVWLIISFKNAKAKLSEEEKEQAQKQFAANLKKHMKTRRMSAHQLAWSAGLSDTSISYYLKAARLPTMPSLIKLSKALDINASELIDKKIL